KVKPYFDYDLNNIKYSWKDVNRENIKCNDVEERNIHHDDSNFVKNTNNTTDLYQDEVPLRILIKQKLDEAFRKPSNMINNVNEDQVNLQKTTSNKIINSEQSLVLILNNEGDTDSTTDKNDPVSSNETFLKHTKCDDRLISIEEESENSLSNYNIVENTGMYLSKLLKFDAKSNNLINNDNNNIASLNDNNDNSAIAAKISKNSFDSSVLFTISENEEEKHDESLPINQETNNENKFVKLETVIDSMSNLSFEQNEDQTMNIFITNDENNVKKEKSFNEQLNLLKKEEMKEINLFDDNSIKFTKNKPKFIDKTTINLQTLYKRHQFTTLYNTSLSKHTSKLSINIKHSPRKNCTILTNKPIKLPSISPADFANSSRKTKTSKISKIPRQSRGNHLNNTSSCLTKLFKSHDINKKQQVSIPQLILTPATPE
ncbi:hypothetical protein M0802_011850, partial [Mischocyttarus mexicanus]